jgi:fumarate reductase (CoM/CoB) subunit A
MQVVKTDVLVIGGGGAAARAAWEAHKAGAKVILATKGAFGAIGTRGAGATASGFSAVGVFATPGWTGAISPVEKTAAHMILAPLQQSYDNIIQVGLGMTDPLLARVMVEDAVGTRQDLLELGATFGESGLRAHGVPIMAALVSHIKHSAVAVMDRTLVTDLIVKDGECLGAVAMHEMNSEVTIIQASSTVVGAGGDADLFMLNLNPPGNTGDSYTLGYRAGAELMNLEFKQIFLGTIHPNRNMLTGSLPPNVKLLNADHREFLHDYLPDGARVEDCLAQRNGHNPFSTRDTLSRYVDIAVVNEVKEGRGTQFNGVYMDRSDSRIPKIIGPPAEYWAYKGIDFSQPVNIGICHHCSLGGMRIDENAQTTVAHLYAAGEAAAGPHGADRMGGHMLLASQVFGARAGKHGAAYALKQKSADLDSSLYKVPAETLESLRQRPGQLKAPDLKNQLRKSAYFDLLVIRSRQNIEKFLAEVERIEAQMADLAVASPIELTEAIELKNLLLLARMEAEVCLTRQESRGGHYRQDYPLQNDKEWNKCVTIKEVNGRSQIGAYTPDLNWKNKGDAKIGYWG